MACEKVNLRLAIAAVLTAIAKIQNKMIMVSGLIISWLLDVVDRERAVVKITYGSWIGSYKSVQLDHHFHSA